MALKKTERKIPTVQASIGVNRGRGFSALKSAVASSSTTEAINAFLSTKVQELKKSEEEKGTKLGKNATLVYENFIDENGESIPIATSYKTPEGEITSSWANHNFHEAAADTLTTGLLLNAKEIIGLGIDDVKAKTSVNTSTADMTAMLRKNLEKPFAILDQNIPEGLEEYYRMKREEMLLNEASSMTSKHSTLRKTYFNSMATEETNQLEKELITLSYTDPTTAEIKIGQLKEKLKMYELQDATNASKELQTRIPALEVLMKVGKNLQQYTTSDFSTSNLSNVNLFQNNLDELQILFSQGPGTTVTMTNLQTGKPESVTFESLGLTEEDVMTYGNDLRIKFSNLTSITGQRGQATQNERDIETMIDLSYRDGFTYFTDKKHTKELGNIIENVNHRTTQKLFSLYNSATGGKLTPENAYADPRRKAAFQQWVASVTGVVPNSTRLQLNGIFTTGVEDINALNRVVSSPTWNLLTGAEVRISPNTVKITDLITTIGLNDTAEQNLLALRQSINIYGDVTEGIQAFVAQQKEAKVRGDIITDKELADVYGYTTALELRGDIQKKILNHFSKTISQDPFINTRFVNQVSDQVMRTLRNSRGTASRGDIVDRMIAKITKNNNYGYSNYSLGVSVLRTGGDDIDLSDSGQQSFVMMPPDVYMKTTAQMDLIQQKIDSVNKVHLEERKRGIYNRNADELIIGKNVHLQLMNHPTDPTDAAYAFIFSEKDGTGQYYVVDDSLNTITVTAEELISAEVEALKKQAGQ